MATEGKQAAGGLAGVLAARGVHYGWLVIAVTFLAMLVTAGVRNIPGVVIVPLEVEFGWDRAAISLAVALSLLAYGLGGPLGGKLIERVGPRTLMAAGVAISAFGSLMLLRMGTLAELVLFWGLVVGISTGMVAMPMGAAVANRWFVKRRGLVVGLLGAGSSAGALVFIPAFMSLTLELGWRAAVGLGAALSLVLAPLIFLCVRDRPADAGLAPYGAEGQTAAQMAAIGHDTPLATALRTRDFWLLAGSFFVCGVTSNGIIGTHLIPHAVEHGFTESVAAGALALVGAFNVVGTIASGYLTDRFNPRLLLASYYAFRAASLVMLPAVTDDLGLLLFAIVFGLDYIATVPPTVALTADRFGRRSVGTIFGWISFGHMVGSALAAYLGGVARVYLGDYTLAFIASGVLAFVAAGLSVGINRARRPKRSAVSATVGGTVAM
jgi:sugar phosphate permease